MRIFSEETRQKMRDAKLKNPTRYWLGKKFSKEHKNKISVGGLDIHRGEKNGNWKGINSKYTASHMWMYSTYGQPKKCENCGRDNLEGKFINWANISGKYKRERDDWIRLCRKCHTSFDDIINKGWDTKRRMQQF